MVLETKIRFNFCYSISMWASTYLVLVFAMYSCLNFFTNCTSSHCIMHCSLRNILHVSVDLFCIPHTDGHVFLKNILHTCLCVPPEKSLPISTL